MKRFVIWMLAALCGAAPGQETEFEKMIAADWGTWLRKGDYPRHFYPSFTDRKAWENAVASPERKKMKEAILRKAEVVLAEPIPELPVTDYVAFKVSGVRTAFEAANFRRRDALGILVLSLGLTGDREKYLPRIIDYLWSICEERTWCLHAHAVYDETDIYPVDSLTRRRVDIFSAETGCKIALASDVCGDALREFSPRIAEIIRRTVIERCILPVLDPDMDQHHTWLGGWNNWSIWICSNLLKIGARFIDDPEQFAALVRKLHHTAGLFYDQTADSGYCNEGPAYWALAGGKLINYLVGCEALYPGSMERVLRREKTVNIAEFPARTAYSELYSMNFGDGRSHLCYNPAPLYAAGGMLRSELLNRYAAAKYRLWLQNLQNELPPYDWRRKTRLHGDRGDFLGDNLEILFGIPADFRPAEHFEPLPSVLYPDQAGLIGVPGGLRAGVKAGCNGESHNHNDLGHFTLYWKNQPLIIDLGTDLYSARTFSGQRYRSIFHNALGHNAPVIHGVGQEEGKDYRAGLTLTEDRAERKTLRCDLSRAYPEAAGLRGLIRTVTVTAAECVLTDTIAAQGPFQLTLFTPVPVRKEGRKLILNEQLSLESPDCAAAEVIPFPCDDANICFSWGKNTLSRIVFTFDKPEYSLFFRLENR